MTWEIYRFDDASAPSLNGTAGSLVALLDAVLVNGYGSKAAAGWTKEFTGTSKAAFRQGAGSNAFYLRVDDADANNARVVGYETMTNVDTGANAFPTNVQVSGGLYVAKSNSTTNRPWLIAADSKRFVLYVGNDNLTSDGFAVATTARVTYFGDIISYKGTDNYGTAIQASNTASSTSNDFPSVSTTFGTQTTFPWLVRNNAGTVGAITTSKLASRRDGGSPSGSAGTRPAYPDPVSNGLLMDRMMIGEPTGRLTRGHLAGCWHLAQQLPGNAGDTFSGTGEYAGRTFILLACGAGSTVARFALETSDTVET